MPDLGGIAQSEIEKRRERTGIPKFMVHAALSVRILRWQELRPATKPATTERQLSDVFEDFTGRVPLAKKLFAGHNPVRTGGPMQVSVAFAEAHAAMHPYPYPQSGRSARRCSPPRRDVLRRRAPAGLSGAV